MLALTVVQQLAWIAEPWVFGRAIDGLIGHHHHPRLERLVVHLALWIGVFAANSGAGVARRIVAERVHTRLFRDVCVAISERGARLGEPAPRTAARAELFRELIVFLDERAPAVVAGIVNLAGSLIALASFDHRIALACLLLGAPLLFAQRIVETRVAHLQREEHDLREQNIDVFATSDPSAVAAHFDAIARARVEAARYGALNFGLLRLFLLAIFVAVLYVAIDLDTFTTGAIYSIVSYLWTFVTYAEDVPTLLEARVSLRDLGRRLDEEPAAATGESP